MLILNERFSLLLLILQVLTVTCLKAAPKFYEVAKRIVEITEDCIIVAHNSEFDYQNSSNRVQTFRLSVLNVETLCTVELSKQLIPGQPSYSLGKLNTMH